MRGKEMLDAVGYVAPELIEKGEAKAKKNQWRKIATRLGAIAAAFIVLIIGVSILPKPMFHGDYPYYPDVESITNASDIIVIGEVITARDVEKLMTDKTPNKTNKEKIPYTISTIRVIDVIKGDVDIGDIITIKQLGDYRYKPEETLHEMNGYLSKDTQHLMFLCEYADSPYSPVNPAQGIIEIKNNYLFSNSRFSLFGYYTDVNMPTDTLKAAVDSVKACMDQNTGININDESEIFRD